MIVITADPGRSGAVAWGRLVIEGARAVVEDAGVVDMPLRYDVTPSGKEFYDTDEAALFVILDKVRPDVGVIEHVSARPPRGPGKGGSTVSEWALACSYAGIRGAFRTWFCANGKGPSTHLVRPPIWKDALGLSSQKDLSLHMAREEYPQLHADLKLKKNEGRAEALLLITYYQRILVPLGDRGIIVI